MGLADATKKQLLEYSLLEGDVLFVRSSVKLEGVGETALVPENLENTTYSGFIIRFRDEYGLNNDFKKYIFGTKKVRNQIMAQATNSANKNISQGVLENLTFEVPSFDEQAKIGEYFSNLDHLITLHQRKIYIFIKKLPIDWEQRKLNEIADRVSEKNKNNEFSEPFTNSAEQGIISQKDYFDREIVNNENLNGYYIVRNDDFIYNPRISVTAPVGPINRNRLGRNGVMSPLYTVFRTHDINNLYLEFYFKTTKWHRFMKLNGDSGARFDRFTISSTQFMEMPIPYPMLDEQIKIGEYFNDLDHLITLHHRECVILRKTKVNDWEQRKLGDIAKLKQGIQVDLERQYTEKAAGRERFIRIVDYTQSTDDIRYIDKTDNANYVDEKDIVVVRYGATAGFVGRGITGIIANNMFTINPLEELDKEFLYTYMKQEKMYNYLNLSNGSSAMPAINFGIMKSLDISYPSTEEQQQIGAYFSNLDHLITLHHRKCIILRKKKMNDWEQRKLGELGEIMTGSTPSLSKSEYYSEDGIPWVTPTDINSQTISDTPRKLSEEGIKVGRVVPANTILCTCIASIGKNTLLTVKGSFNQQINCLTPNEYNDAYFLLTESEIWSNIMKHMAAAGTVQIVNKTEFSELTTMVPKLEEQKKIGQYFLTLDRLITLHHHEEFCTENVLIYIEINKTIQIKEDIMAELESVIEQKLIDQLVYGDSQWTYRADLKTEEDLWNNFRYILEQNNKDRLNGEPLSDTEFEQVKNQLQFSSFYKAGEWLVGENGKVMVHVQRDSNEP